LKDLSKQRLQNLIDGMGERRDSWIKGSIISYFIFLKDLFNQRLENSIGEKGLVGRSLNHFIFYFLEGSIQTKA